MRKTAPTRFNNRSKGNGIGHPSHKSKKRHIGRWIAGLFVLCALYSYGTQDASEHTARNIDVKDPIQITSEPALLPVDHKGTDLKAGAQTSVHSTTDVKQRDAVKSSDAISDAETFVGKSDAASQPATPMPKATQAAGQLDVNPTEQKGAGDILFEGITNNTVNLREKASKDSARIEQLQKGTLVQVLDVQTVGGKDWYRVRDEEGKLGYVFGSYVDRQMVVTMLNQSFTADEIDAQILSGVPIPDSHVIDIAPTQGTATAIFAGCGVYSGAFSEGRRSGFGTFVWENGDVYTGEWTDDRLSGEGTFALADGTVYEGQFLRGKFKSGVIHKKQENGAVLTRTVSDGEIKKKAKLKFEDGTLVEGNVVKGEISGSVTILYANGDRYQGTISDSLKSGQGTYTWTDGAHYSGSWKNDKMNGNGAYYFSQDEKLQFITGKFVDNQPAGSMTYTAGNGIKYSTLWDNGSCIMIEYKRK